MRREESPPGGPAQGSFAEIGRHIPAALKEAFGEAPGRRGRRGLAVSMAAQAPKPPRSLGLPKVLPPVATDQAAPKANLGADEEDNSEAVGEENIDEVAGSDGDKSITDNAVADQADERGEATKDSDGPAEIIVDTPKDTVVADVAGEGDDLAVGNGEAVGDDGEEDVAGRAVVDNGNEEANEVENVDGPAEMVVDTPKNTFVVNVMGAGNENETKTGQVDKDDQDDDIIMIGVGIKRKDNRDDSISEASTDQGGSRGGHDDVSNDGELDDDDVQISPSLNTLSNHRRAETYYGRCPCNTGNDNLDFWVNAPETESGGPPQRGRKFIVKAGEAPTFTFDIDVSELTIQCDGSDTVGRINVNVSAGLPFTVHLEVADNNSDHHFCNEKSAGFVTVTSWESVPQTAGPIFVSGTEGYACFKSPQLLRLRDGTLIAFAQAFWPSCHESSHSTIVFRRSEDGGSRWSQLAQLANIDEGARNRLGLCGNPLSMSNVVPIELKERFPGRIVVLYMRNHYKTWLIRSDNGGKSWGADHEIPTASPSADAGASPDCSRAIDWFGAGPGPLTYIKELGKWLLGVCWYVDNNPYEDSSVGQRLSGLDWQWVGIGPGGGIELSAGENKGRLLVPGYHSFIRSLDPHREAYNPTAHFWRNTAESHMLISDDGGETWVMSPGSLVQSYTSRDTNFFQLSDGEVYANSATLALGTPQFRTQARVNANVSSGTVLEFDGLNFTEIPQPLGGCQGAAIADADDAVYVSGPDGPPSASVDAIEEDIERCKFNATGRSALTVWRSYDKGQTFPDSVVVDADLSADSSIQVHDGKVFVLYEQADDFPDYEMYGQRRRLGDLQIFDPDRIIFTTLEFPPRAETDQGDGDDSDSTGENGTEGQIGEPAQNNEDAQIGEVVQSTSNMPTGTEPHQLVFNTSDDFIDLAYYDSKENCQSNQHAVGWYIRKENAGSMMQGATDCQCHQGLTTDGSDKLSIFPCLYPEDNKMALSLFTGEECTVDESTQINVFDQDMSNFRQGKCAEARVLLNGEREKPWTMYVRFEVNPQ